MKINGKPDGGGGGGVITELSVTSNGIYIAGAGVDGYSPIDVDVPSPEFVTEVLNVSVNNTYYPGQGVDGFSQVIVDVPQSVAGFTEKEITEETYAIYNLNNSASFVHRNVFEGDNNLLTVNLPNASYVGAEAFKFCNNLTRVDMATCQVIDDQGFYACEDKLSQVNMPELISVSGNIFAFCRKLEKVDFPKLSSMGTNVFSMCNGLSQVSLPEIEYLPQNTFNECSSLTSIYIPKCKILDRYAFARCVNLQDIDFTKFTSIGAGAFQYCSALSQVILTNCNSWDPQNTFNNCSSLELLSFGDTYIKFTYNNTLTNTKIASGLGSIYVPDYNYSWYITANGWSSLASTFVSYETSGSPLNYSDGLVYGSTPYLDYNFISALGISYMAVTGMDLPDCTELFIRPGYQSTYAIRQCKNLLSITIGLSSVNESVFGDPMNKLQTVSLPECTYIGNSTFVRNFSLTQISVPLCEYVGSKAFQECSSLLSIDLPLCSNIKDQTFFGCKSLTQVSIPLCETIGWMGFYSCHNLTSIDLPVCSYIAQEAFHYCSSLSQMYLRSNSVCTLQVENPFNGGPLTIRGSGSFFVPASLVDAYKTARYWSRYSSQIFPIPE